MDFVPGPADLLAKVTTQRREVFVEVAFVPDTLPMWFFGGGAVAGFQASLHLSLHLAVIALLRPASHARAGPRAFYQNLCHIRTHDVLLLRKETRVRKQGS